MTETTGGRFGDAELVEDDVVDAGGEVVVVVDVVVGGEVGPVSFGSSQLATSINPSNAPALAFKVRSSRNSRKSLQWMLRT